MNDKWPLGTPIGCSFMLFGGPLFLTWLSWLYDQDSKWKLFLALGFSVGSIVFAVYWWKGWGPSASPGRSIPGTNTQTYTEYLRSPHWQQVRRAAIDRAGYRCQICNNPHRLQVHHRTYERKGHELPEDLIVLCDRCHAKFHEGGRMPNKH